jgi:hypothetical protein
MLLKNPKVGDVWTNGSPFTVGAINPGEAAVWSGRMWAPTFGRDPMSIRFSTMKD